MNFRTWVLLLAVTLQALPAMAGEKDLLKTREDKVSYATGVELARTFRSQEVSIEPELLLKGLQDEMAGKKPLMSTRERRSLLRQTQSESMARMARKRQQEAQGNLRKEKEFLAANKTKAGVAALASGLQYRIVKKGAGKIPTDDDTVECNFVATHLDGTELDASDPGKPVSMKIAKLLPGWREALKIMPEGSIWQLFVPAKLAYGERGAGLDIGPNEMLIFRVELVKVE